MKNLQSVFAMLVVVLCTFGCARAAYSQGAEGQVRWAEYTPRSSTSNQGESPALADAQPANGYAERPAPTGTVPTSTPEETLQDAWRVALENDDRIKAGNWNVSAADNARAAACAEARPSVDVGAGFLALSEEVSIASPIGPFPMVGQGTAGFHATVTQPLYTAGRIDSQAAAAGADVSANRSQVQRTRLDVKMNVAEVYVAVLRGKRVLSVAETRVNSLKAHALDVDNRFQADKASRNEVLAVQVSLADAQQQELRAANALEMSKAAYNRALGRNLAETVSIVDLQDDGDPASVDELVRTAWRCRPELAELTARATALREQAAAECSKTSPQVSLRGGYVYQGDKYLSPNGIAGVALTAEWNLFDSGRAEHQATALSQRAEATLRMRRDAEASIALEIRQRWLEYQTAKQQIAFARVAIAQADENLRVVRDRYVQQLGNNTEVLDAETLRAQAYMNWCNNIYDALLVRLRLRRAVGTL